jgi:hypothetical protein
VRQAAAALGSDLTGRRALPLQAESRRSAAPEEQATAIRPSSRAARHWAVEAGPAPALALEAEEAEAALLAAAQ